MNFEKYQAVVLENGIEYVILDMTYYNSDKYLLLTKMNDDDFTVVKLNSVNNKVVLSKLTDEEYEVVIKQFHENQLKNQE